MKNTWDLENIFKTTKEYNDTLIKIKQLTNNLEQTYKGSLLKNANTFYNALKEKEKKDRLFEKAYMYAYLSYYACTKEENNKLLINKIDILYDYINEIDNWFNIEIKKITKNKYNEFIKEKEELKEYMFLIENILREKKHTLSTKEEELISKLNPCFNKSNKIFSVLNNTDCNFENIELDNNTYELNHSTFSLYIKDNNRELRKQAFIKYFDYYKNHKNTIAEIYINAVKANNKYSIIKKYKGQLDNELYSDNINEKVFNNIIEVVNKNIPLLQKYIKLKKKESKIEDYNYYDLYSKPITKEIKYNYEKGKKLVINSLSILGEEYVNILNKAFDERWIDVYYKDGKRSGAFSWGSYDTFPYVLLNYEDDYNSVSTLAHELGHSVNSYYSKTQPYVYSGNSIFTAEIASTVNEFLLANYILNNSKDKEEKLNILREILEHFRTTIFRQVLFTEFEKEIYDKELNKEVLTEKILSDTYYKITNKYYKDTLNYFDNYKYEWARIPHFYTPFYVYKYATGMSTACAIVNNIIEQKDNALTNYIEFLKSGDSDFPLNLLKKYGYNLNNKKIFENAMKLFNKYIKQYEDLIDNA